MIKKELISEIDKQYKKRIQALEVELNRLKLEHTASVEKIRSTCEHKDDNGMFIGTCIHCGLCLGW